MPIYHLEIRDGERIILDDYGAEYHDVETAMRELNSTLLLVLAETQLDQENRDIVGVMSDQRGTMIYTAVLTLRCQ